MTNLRAILARRANRNVVKSFAKNYSVEPGLFLRLAERSKHYSQLSFPRDNEEVDGEARNRTSTTNEEHDYEEDRDPCFQTVL